MTKRWFQGSGRRISDGENYDDVVAELEATNETLPENLRSDNDTLVQQKLELEEQIAQRKKELEEKERKLSQDAVIAGNEEAIKEAKQEAEELEAQRAKQNATRGVDEKQRRFPKGIEPQKFLGG